MLLHLYQQNYLTTAYQKGFSKNFKIISNNSRLQKRTREFML